MIRPVDSPLPFASRRARVRRLRSGPAPAPGPTPFSLPLPAGIHVGTAQVLDCQSDGRPRLRLTATGAEVVATWALPWRYAPAPGDLLRVAGQRGRFWVVGVVLGRGRSLVAFPGDARLEAGRLRLVAGRGLRLVAPRVTLRAGGRLERAAGQLQERLGLAARTVRGLLQQVAGRVVRLTEGEESVAAERVTVVAADLVKVDGEVVQVN